MLTLSNQDTIFSHLKDAFIQRNLQVNYTAAKNIKSKEPSEEKEIVKSYNPVILLVILPNNKAVQALDTSQSLIALKKWCT